MNTLQPDNLTKGGLAARICGWAILLFFMLSVNTALAREPSAMDDASRIDLIEELYKNYEAVDRELGDLRDALEGAPSPVPLIISAKKEKGFRLIYVAVEEDGETLWEHRYSGRENEALEGGGRHQFYEGTARKGRHTLVITYQYVAPESGVEKGAELRWDLELIEEAYYLEVFFRASGDEVVAETRELRLTEPETRGPGDEGDEGDEGGERGETD